MMARASIFPLTPNATFCHTNLAKIDSLRDSRSATFAALNNVLICFNLYLISNHLVILNNKIIIITLIIIYIYYILQFTFETSQQTLDVACTCRSAPDPVSPSCPRY